MPGKPGRPAGRRLAFLLGLKRAQQLDQRLDAVGRVVPHLVVGVGGHGEVLQPAHRRHESAETRAGAGRAVFGKAAVVFVFGVEFFGILGAGIRHGRAARTSRRTMV